MYKLANYLIESHKKREIKLELTTNKSESDGKNVNEIFIRPNSSKGIKPFREVKAKLKESLPVESKIQTLGNNYIRLTCMEKSPKITELYKILKAWTELEEEKRNQI